MGCTQAIANPIVVQPGWVEAKDVVTCMETLYCTSASWEPPRYLKSHVPLSSSFVSKVTRQRPLKIVHIRLILHGTNGLDTQDNGTRCFGSLLVVIGHHWSLWIFKICWSRPPRWPGTRCFSSLVVIGHRGGGGVPEKLARKPSPWGKRQGL